jgi:hypothetical protein
MLQSWKKIKKNLKEKNFVKKKMANNISDYSIFQHQLFKK